MGISAFCGGGVARGTDRDWTELVDDPGWPIVPQFGGGVSFLDAIGFRYYLPVLMLRELEGGCAVVALEFHLTHDEGESGRYHLTQWSLLDGTQRRCVRRFLRYMAALEQASGTSVGPWAEALHSYWERVE